MLLALLLSAIAPIAGPAQEHDPIVNEKWAGDATTVARSVCKALTSGDPSQLHANAAPGFHAAGLQGATDIDLDGFATQLHDERAKAAIVRRCSFKPFQFNTDAAHRRFVARFQLLFSGTDRSGVRFSDRGDVDVELARPADTLQLSRLEFLPRQRVIGGAPEFRDVGPDIGLGPGLARLDSEVALAPFLLENGGVAVGDYDGDGLLDIYVPAQGHNLLFHNEGNGTFKEVAKQAGVASTGMGRSALWVDLDNDGDLDLFVANSQFDRPGKPPSTGGGNRLFRNDGHGHFTDISHEAGVDQMGYFSSVAAADVDGDGLLDIVVGQYQDLRVPRHPLDAHNGKPSLLLHNLGNMKFKEIGKQVGVAGHEWTLAVALADLDGDRKPELVMINDYGSPRLYHNISRGPGDVRFEEMTTQSGVVDPGNGMGIDVADYDGDGLPDLSISKMFSKAGNRLLSMDLNGDQKWLDIAKTAARGNSLFHNGGKLHFDEVGDTAGIRRAGWAWGCEFGDVDNDGTLDLYVANGYHTGPSEDDL